MTLKTVTVIDYGVGNLLSVRRGLEYNDALVKVTGDPEEIFQSCLLYTSPSPRD